MHGHGVGVLIFPFKRFWVKESSLITLPHNRPVTPNEPKKI